MSFALMRRGAIDQNRAVAAGWTYQSLPTAGPSGLKIPIPPGFKIWFSDGFDYADRNAMLAASFNSLPIYSAYSGQDGAYATGYWDPTHVTCTGSQAVLSGFFDSNVVATKYVTGGMSTGPLAANGHVPAGALWLWCTREEAVSPAPVKVAGMTYGTNYPPAGKFTKYNVAAGNDYSEWPYDGEADIRESDQGSGTVDTRLHWHDPASVGSGNVKGELKSTASTLTVDTTHWVIHGAYTGSDGTFHSFTNDAGASDAPLREWLTQAGVDASFAKGGRRWITQQEAYGQPIVGTGTTKVYVDWVACLVPIAVGNSTPPAQILDLTRWKTTLPVDVNNLTTGTAVEWKHPQIEKASHGSFFTATTAGDGVVFMANCLGAKTGASDFARSELREMELDGVTQAAWAPGDGGVHSMQAVMSIDHLPDHRPIVVPGQIHGPSTASFLLLQADGFRPVSGSTYIKGSDTGAFTLMCKVNDASSTQAEYDVILPGLTLGAKFTYKLEASGGTVKVYADLGSVSTPTLRATITNNIPSSGCYFKVGLYNQSGADNSSKTVPGTAQGGPNLTAPIASGSPTGNAGVTEYGQSTIYNLTVTHGTSVTAYPSNVIDLSQWKITLPITSSGSLGPNGSAPLEILQPTLAAYKHDSYFYNSNNLAAVFVAPASGATTSGTANPRCELREMVPPSTGSANQAAWSTTSGTHTLSVTGKVLQLPQNKAQLVIAQIHDPIDDFEILADGFSPTSSGTYVHNTDVTPFVIGYRDWTGSQDYTTPLISGVHMGDVYTVKLVAGSGVVKIYADLGYEAHTLRKTVTGVSRTGCYFKAGAYTQANSSNAGKSVPSSHYSGVTLTTPAPNSSIAGEPAGSAGSAAILALSVVHDTGVTAYALQEDWSGFPLNMSWIEGENRGQWYVTFASYGPITIENDGGKVLSQTPLAPANAGETYSSLVTSAKTFTGDIDATFRMKTVSQNRTGAYPGAVVNDWERAWVFWNYTDNTHFYSFFLKTTGWELGKEDPAYPGAQRFLATGATPTSALGFWNTVRVRQVGTTITVWVDGVQVANVTDSETPYTSGKLGLYNEDSHSRFGPVTVN